MAGDLNGYPETTVDPTLFTAKGSCNTDLPGGEVVEWYDFGQFVELLAVDAAGISHPVVLANGEEIARASGEIGKGDAIPLRVVDVAGGIPLTDLVDEARGHGSGALRPLAAAREIPVLDVDQVIREGRVAQGGATYLLTLSRQEAQALADGEQIVRAAKLADALDGREVTVRLAPVVYDVPLHDVDALLADRTVILDKVSYTLALEPAEVTALLTARTVVVRVTAGDRTTLVRLVQTGAVSDSVPLRPGAADNVIDDLSAFLANPVVNGDNGKPFRVPLSKKAVHELRTVGSTTVTLADNFVFSVTVAKPVAMPALSRMALMPAMMRRQDSGHLPPDKAPDERIETKTQEKPDRTASTVGDMATISMETGRYFERLMKTADGVTRMKKFLEASQPLPPEKTAPPRPPFRLRVALFLPWRQTWTMKGFSRGRLLQSLALAPQEEATIELHTWERHRKTLEQSSQTDTEQAVEGTDTTKDTSECYRELQQQSDFQYQVGGSFKATYRPAAGEIEIGANATLSGKNAVTQVGKNTQTRLHEAVIKASTKVRAQRTTKITESVEWGSEQRVTRKIRNPNLCHTLNLDYYEVLAHYDISTAFLPADTKLCAMVDNPMSVSSFEANIVAVNETALRDGLLDPALADGFEAIRYLGAYGEAKAELSDRKSAAAIAAKIGQDDKKQEPETTPKPPSRQEAEILAALKGLYTAARLFTSGSSPQALLGAISRHDPIGDDARRSARRWMYGRLVEAKFPNFAATLRDLGVVSDPTADSVPFAQRLELARRLAAQVPPGTGSPTLGKLNELTDADKESAGLATEIHRHMAVAWDWAWWTSRCREEQLYTADDMGIPVAAQRLADKMLALDTAPTVADAAAEKGQAQADKAGQRQDQQAAEDVLEMKFGLEEVGRARERSKTLRDHLNEHRDYYRYVLFQALPPSEQLERLMGGSGGALRVGMFEPRVVSMHGPYLAVPLHAAGEDLVSTFRTTIVASLQSMATSTSRIMLPTPGMTIESRLGRCSAGESFIEKSREYELRRLEATARQAEAEADRLEARVAAHQLDDPNPVPAPVGVRTEKSDPAVRG
ncbi:hypothetical protein G6045_11825 [Streptomyces sp. YC504]|uniref:Uncharacterized protein n=1 Tax=Streptomyces mesophilus TaxID=1775132 RepID=A0A6G4XGI2_9ACTN|nr:hypothetical protein [Streptomyces mesophilus]NGO76343.1 hypothetical protein [Streptomyces mesophilus]